MSIWRRIVDGAQALGGPLGALARTLDPAATGVLPVAVGPATRMIEFLEGATKSYLAEVTCGVETDSYDADGTVTSISAARQPAAAEIAAVLAGWLGPRLQVPPMHSAVKIAGRRLYESARKGIGAVAAGDDTERIRGEHGAGDLRHDVGNDVVGLHASAGEQAECDSGIEVAARDVPDGIRHGDDGETEGQRDADQADADVRERGCEHCAAATSEHQPERA